MADVDEGVLIALARGGDQAAFSALVGLHKARVWAVCLRVTGNRHDAEDALQDALTAVWQNLDRFRGEARFSTWMHRVASNAALGVIRRRRDFVSEDLEGIEDRTQSRDVAARVVDVDQVQTALRGLPEDFRVALVLREYGDLTYEEIAVHQGVPVQTVKSRLNRARRMLAEELTLHHA